MHLEDFNLNKDSANKPNWLTFTQDSDGNAATAGTSTITATTAQFANVTVGSIIDVTGTANNNGTYEVSAVTGGGTTIEINTKMLTDATSGATMTGTDGTVVNTNVTFNRAAGTIVGAAGTLSTLATGSSFVVSGTAQNDGTYIVESNDGTTLSVKERSEERRVGKECRTRGSPYDGKKHTQLMCRRPRENLRSADER